MLLATSSGMAGGTSDPSAEPEYPIALGVVPEMAAVPGLDEWETCQPDEFPEHAAAVAKDWEKRHAFVARHLTPELVRGLSRWSRKQMANYVKMPSIEKLVWKPVARNAGKTKLAYEATVETLPSHSPIVTRWLKLFLVYDMRTRSITGVEVTIRGEAQE